MTRRGCYIHVLLLVLLIMSQAFSPIAVHAEEKMNIENDVEVDGDEEERRVVIVSASGDVENAVETVKTRIPSAKIRQVYKEVYRGFSLEVLERDIPTLEKLSVIARVDDIAIYQPSIEGSIDFVGGGREASRYFDAKGRRITGAGVKVGVIDTGIDYEHPDLRRNYKGGYDVIDDDDQPMETKSPQGEPTLHGTHVAGIIAANGRIQGVAPEADIYAYRALGPGGQGTTEQVLTAIERAVGDGVDVLNLSLGNTINGPDWPTSLALDRVVDKGVVAVTSSGNSGPNMWSVGSPGTSTKAISVGASLPPIDVPYITLFTDQAHHIPLAPIAGAKPWTFKRDVALVDVGHGLVADYRDLSVKGKVVLVKRGRATFAEKLMTAKRAGAIGVLLYNHLDGAFAGGVLEPIDIPAASLSKEDGEWLLTHMNEKKKTAYIRTKFERKQDLIASFSSRGPVTETWQVKPDLVAPGVAIQSTVPKGYLGLNGTSMSSPHVAGAAALLLQLHPEWTPEQVKAALMNTTKTLTSERGQPYKPHEQGTGRLQVDQALRAETLVYPGTLTFGTWSKNAARTKRTLSLTIENTGLRAKTYYIDPPIGSLDGIGWQTPYAVRVVPGEKKVVQLSADIFPAALQEGLHAGIITIKGDRLPIEVPYVLFMEEPNYPRVMAFQFAHADKKNHYYYEYYLPGGAEKSGIALYDPDTFTFVTNLVENEQTHRGMISGELSDVTVPPGRYKALVYAEQSGVQDTIETYIEIGQADKHIREE
ncbi:S8 family serine peptidase [Bacillus sp. FSL W7-1360]